MLDHVTWMLAQGGDDVPTASPTAPTGNGANGNGTLIEGADDGTDGGGGAANGGQGGGGLGGLSPMLFILVIFGLFFFMMTRSQSKEKKKRATMIAALSKGDKVQTVGGVLGTVVEVRDTEIVVKVDENTNTRMRFGRSAVQSVLNEDQGG